TNNKQLKYFKEKESVKRGGYYFPIPLLVFWRSNSLNNAAPMRCIDYVFCLFTHQNNGATIV
ncbi:MAG: hypothetical protein AAGK47_10255, partial [Bacteroidota bacterium]